MIIQRVSMLLVKSIKQNYLFLVVQLYFLFSRRTREPLEVKGEKIKLKLRLNSNIELREITELFRGNNKESKKCK